MLAGWGGGQMEEEGMCQGRVPGFPVGQTNIFRLVAAFLSSGCQGFGWGDENLGVCVCGGWSSFSHPGR